MKVNSKNIKSFIIGWLRYYLYYSRYFSWMLPNHIHEQIDARIASMDVDCYLEGSCKMCGCTTTALQMANKACDKPCYPAMKNRKDWKYMKKSGTYLWDAETRKAWKLKGGEFEIFTN